MKKTIGILLILGFSLSGFSQDSTKMKVEFEASAWQTYLRNIDRLNAFAGRSVPSEILFATKDTIQAFEQIFINQLNKQLPKKEGK